MTNQEKIAKTKELFESKEFTEKFSQVATVAEAQELFKSYGIEISAEEFQMIGEIAKGIKSGELEEGELPDDLAEKVAGGAAGIGDYIKGFAAILYGFAGIIDQVMKLFKGEKIDNNPLEPKTEEDSTANKSTTKKTITPTTTEAAE